MSTTPPPSAPPGPISGRPDDFRSRQAFKALSKGRFVRQAREDGLLDPDEQVQSAVLLQKASQGSVMLFGLFAQRSAQVIVTDTKVLISNWYLFGQRGAAANALSEARPFDVAFLTATPKPMHQMGAQVGLAPAVAAFLGRDAAYVLQGSLAEHAFSLAREAPKA